MDDLLKEATNRSASQPPETDFSLDQDKDDFRLKIIGDPLFADTRALILTC